MSRNAKLVILFLAAGSIAPEGAGVVIRHDRDDAAYRMLADEYPAVGRLYPHGSATLIAPRWVLTASHCLLVVEDELQFELGGTRYQGEAWFWHPSSYVGDHCIDMDHDLALVRLREPVVGVEPASLYKGDPDRKEELEKVLTFVGFGNTGTGLTGESGTEGTKRAAENVVDAIGGKVDDAEWSENLLLADFDDPRPLPGEPDASNPLGSEEPLDLEGAIGHGDSGGGAFMDLGEGPVLVGVNSGTWSDRTIPRRRANLAPYGTYARFTRICRYVDWIEKTIRVVENPQHAESRPLVSIAAIELQVVEGKVIPAFRIERDGDPTDPLVVHWKVGGAAVQATMVRRPEDADYELETDGDPARILSSFAVVAAGVRSANVVVESKQDGREEASEEVTLTLVENALYRIGAGSAATVALADP